jgi:hypothetical protein
MNYATVRFQNPLYYIYYDIADCDGCRRIITYNKKITSIEKSNEIYENFTAFPLRFTDMALTDKNLTAYSYKFEKWMKELIYNNCKHNINHPTRAGKSFPIDFSIGDNKTLEMTFFKLCHNYDQMESIKTEEYKVIKHCFNGGLSYLKKDNIKLECETFDCKSCYANILNSDTLVPIKAGKYITLEALPRIRDLQVGIYKIIITSTHRDARKCFSFAKDHHYTNISLAFAMKHRKQLEFEFEWLEEENNAYVYEHCVPLNSMCGDWVKASIQRKPFSKITSVRYMGSLVCEAV